MNEPQKRILTASAAALVTSLIATLPTSPAAATPGDYPVKVAPPLHRAPAALEPSSQGGPAACLRSTGGVFACQDPASIRKAYNIPASADGAGRTVVIIDAFGSPTLQSDLDTFSDTFDLPRTTVQVIYPGGKPAWSGTANQLGWAEETSLDVQWAHAIAPKATIKLVVAATNYGSALANAQSYVAAHDLGDAVSMSYGIPEGALSGNDGQTTQSSAGLQAMSDKGMTVFASSGDSGSDNGLGFSNFSEPASDPNVTAVGGTNLWYGTKVSRQRETVWGDYDASNCPTCAYGPFGATGGAPSILNAKTGSDVAYNASVYTGVLTYLGFLGSDNGFYFFGGTSAGSPQWAAIAALADNAQGGKRLGTLDAAVLSRWAAAGLLYDVTSGSNLTPTFPSQYSATSGPDSPTGYGTPNVGMILAYLAKH